MTNAPVYDPQGVYDASYFARRLLRPSSSPSFLSVDEEQFVKRYNYTATPKYDEHVESFRGSLLTEASRAVLAKHFDDQTIREAAVYLYFFDNSDIQCPRTYKVEIGLPKGQIITSDGGGGCSDTHRSMFDAIETPVGSFRSTFGVFGSSGSACTGIESAFEQAAINFIMKLLVEPQSNMNAHNHRN